MPIKLIPNSLDACAHKLSAHDFICVSVEDRTDHISLVPCESSVDVLRLYPLQAKVRVLRNQIATCFLSHAIPSMEATIESVHNNVVRPGKVIRLTDARRCYRHDCHRQ